MMSVYAWLQVYNYLRHTIDGSEIRHPPVEGTVVYPAIYRVRDTSQVVVWDFFHQQYLHPKIHHKLFQLNDEPNLYVREMHGNHQTSIH